MKLNWKKCMVFLCFVVIGAFVAKIYTYNLVPGKKDYYMVIYSESIKKTNMFELPIILEDEQSHFVFPSFKYYYLPKSGEHKMTLHPRFIDGREALLEVSIGYKLPHFHRSDVILPILDKTDVPELMVRFIEPRVLEGVYILASTMTPPETKEEIEDFLSNVVDQAENGAYEYESSALVYTETGERKLVKFPTRIKINSIGSPVRNKIFINKREISITVKVVKFEILNSDEI